MPYPVSQAFMDAMKANVRHVLAKVVIDYTDPFMDQSIEIAANEEANISYPTQVADSVAAPGRKWASLDGSWVLDGTYCLAPATIGQAVMYQMGWWGLQLADPSGAFTAPYPSLEVTHQERPIHALRVTGDASRAEYPVDFVVQLYAANGALLHTENVTNNSDVSWLTTLTTPVLDVARQVLTVTKWSHAGRQVKILEFFTSIQEVYLPGDLISLSLLEEREVSQGSLPVGNISANEIALSLSNKTRKFDLDNDQSPLYRLLKVNRKVRVWVGAEIEGSPEWVPLGTFWTLDSWSAPDDSLQATVTARDRLELLRKGTYASSQVLTYVSLGDLAELVLDDAGVVTSDYNIDASLYSVIVPYAWFAAVTHREALRQIAEAGLAVIYCDRDGAIRIESYASSGGSPVMVFTPNDYYRTQTPSQLSQLVNEVIVTTQPLRPADAVEEVYRSNELIFVPSGGSVTATVYYNSSPVIDAAASLDSPPTSVAVVAAEYKGWGAEVTISNTGESAANVTLVVIGKPLNVTNQERVVAKDEQSIIDNAVLRYEFPANHLVQTLTQAQAIADTLLASAKDPRRDIEIEWGGNPALLLGDQITAKGVNFGVTKQELEWAGYLRETTTGRRVV